MSILQFTTFHAKKQLLIWFPISNTTKLQRFHAAECPKGFLIAGIVCAIATLRLQCCNGTPAMFMCRKCVELVAGESFAISVSAFYDTLDTLK